MLTGLGLAEVNFIALEFRPIIKNYSLKLIIEFIILLFHLHFSSSNQLFRISVTSLRHPIIMSEIQQRHSELP